jgi:adenosylcobyric acid synthase
LAGLAPTDWIILPGSKHTSGDLAWLRQQGLDRAIATHAGQGGAVLGICGGLQMLGEALIDTHGIDGNAPGLGLLPLVTSFEAEKTVQHTQAVFDARITEHEKLFKTDWVHGKIQIPVSTPWAALAGVQVSGYEIHHGQTAQHPAMAKAGDVACAVMPNGLAWQNGAGNVLGLYLHGLFEDPAALQALFGASLHGPVPTLDSVFDGLADFIELHFEPGFLQGLLV